MGLRPVDGFYDSRDNSATGAFGHTYLWFPRLFEDPCFDQRRIDRWQALRAGPLATAHVDAIIDAIPPRSPSQSPPRTSPSGTPPTIRRGQAAGRRRSPT
ncbi:MAG: hypothetical protein R3F11_03700 [Verrucomicrobiales bacterium]